MERVAASLEPELRVARGRRDARDLGGDERCGSGRGRGGGAVGWLALAHRRRCVPERADTRATIPGSSVGATPPVASDTRCQSHDRRQRGLTADQVFALVVTGRSRFVQTETATGSGFAVDDRHVVTNAHVVRPSGVVPSASPVMSAHRRPGRRLGPGGRSRRARDARCAVPTRPCCDRRAGAADRRARVPRRLSAGRPTTPTATITEGIISGSPFEWVDGLTYQQTDAVIEDGQSGGVLVDERRRSCLA